jgi:hypothetical protein
MGDPLSHPLFAGSTEDLEGNEMVEAFRCLREEDKTPVELAVLYKDEGNEWMKKKVKKDLKEAIIRYTHALGFLDEDDRSGGGDSDDKDKDEEEEPQVVLLDEEGEEGGDKSVSGVQVGVEDVTVKEQQQQKEEEESSRAAGGGTGRNSVLRSQILNNRALASMHLKNFGSALGDINMVCPVCVCVCMCGCLCV